jgi:hypothetical protein
MPVARKAELVREEDAGWAELESLLEDLTPAQCEEPGYLAEGWSVKDLMAHVGAWMAEAARELQRMRIGTYESRPLDVDAMNREFHEANRDLPLPMVRAELWAARTRMHQEWNALPEITPEGEEWFRESGVVHYGEHIDRLREWVEELRSRR